MGGTAEQRYIDYCSVCHGDRGRGSAACEAEGAGDGPRAYFILPKPRSFLDAATQQILNRLRLFDGIKDGIIGREMPAWGKVMDDQDIADIADYVYLQFIRRERETTTSQRRLSILATPPKLPTQ